MNFLLHYKIYLNLRKKLVVSIYHIQELMWHIEPDKPSSVHHEISPFITLSSSLQQISSHLICQSCTLACSKGHAPKVKQPATTYQDQAGDLAQDAYKAGNLVTAYQYVDNALGSLVSDFKYENPHNQYHGVKIFIILLLVLLWLKIKFLVLLKFWWQTTKKWIEQCLWGCLTRTNEFTTFGPNAVLIHTAKCTDKKFRRKQSIIFWIKLVVPC